VSGLARASLRAFGTIAVLATTEPAALAPARRLLVGALRSLDLACSRFRSDSELVALNAAGGRPLRVGETLFAAVEAALGAAAMTAGLVDPTVGRALRLAGYDISFERLRLRDGDGFWPAFEPAGRYAEIELDPRRRTVRLPRGVELDLGASAKAHTADRVAAAAAAAAGTGVLVSIGGDVAVAGRAPASGWPVRVADDHASPGGGPVVAIGSGGLASSGTTVRHWRSAVGELHHIIDPRTGAPARTPWTTVSVAAASCLEANAAATAAIVLGAQAPAWLSARALPARLLDRAGAVVHVGGWPAAEAA
jgi:thiamine biosynthesis lipoprotein